MSTAQMTEFLKSKSALFQNVSNGHFIVNIEFMPALLLLIKYTIVTKCFDQ